MRVELMAAESSSNRGKKESTASGLLNSPTRLNDDVEDPVKSPPHSPNNSSTRKWEPKRSPRSLKLADEYSKGRNKRMVANSFTSQFEKSLLNMSYVSHIEGLEARCRAKSIRPMKRSPYYPAAKACYAVLQSWVSKKFMTGCVVLFPVAVTFFITWWFIQFVDGFFSPIYERLGIDIFGLGFVTSIIFIFFVGIFASSWLGSTVFLIGEWFIKRMPFVKHIYSASKQISSAISPDQNTTAFKEVAIIRHPRVGEYAFGFITSSVVLQRDNGDEELCSVYVPTNHLYIGDIFLVNSKDIIRPNLSIREGIEIIVSVGMSMPQIISPIEEHARLNDRIPPSRMLI